MNIPNLTPERPQQPKPARSFEDVIKELQPQLDKLPPEQRIPPLPPDQQTLEGVQEFVRANGMDVPESCPSIIALSGEFLDRGGLREARTGLHENVIVVSFLYRYPDKILRSVVIYPRDGIDARLLGMALCWGLVADVPPTVAQSRICDVRDFFAINAFDLDGIIDVPALERFKDDWRELVAAEWAEFRYRSKCRITALEHDRDSLAGTCKKLGNDLQTQKREAVAEHNRAEAWKIAAVCTLALLPIIHILLRFAGF